MTEPTPDPGALLTAAADRLETLAATVPPGPWEPGGIGDYGWTVRAGDQTVETDDSDQGRHLATWIAAMHPGVSRAFVGWLREAAHAHRANVIAAQQVFGDDTAAADAWLLKMTSPGATATARALLATAPHGPQDAAGAAGADTEPSDGRSDAHTGAQQCGDVQGRCPACGGESLFLGDGGYVTCRRDTCPEPDAASTQLERQRATPPVGLRDRIAHELHACGGPFMTTTAEDLADAVLAIRDQHMEQLVEAAARYEMDRCAAVNRRRDAEHRAERAEAAVRRVRSIHADDGTGHCATCRMREHPCPTVRALDGAITPMED